jgi:hypothetical protein
MPQIPLGQRSQPPGLQCRPREAWNFPPSTEEQGLGRYLDSLIFLQPALGVGGVGAELTVVLFASKLMCVRAQLRPAGTCCSAAMPSHSLRFQSSCCLCPGCGLTTPQNSKAAAQQGLEWPGGETEPNGESKVFLRTTTWKGHRKK